LVFQFLAITGALLHSVREHVRSSYLQTSDA
jgi:hypothetical protein